MCGESQNTVSHQNVECRLHPRARPAGMCGGVSFTNLTTAGPPLQGARRARSGCGSAQAPPTPSAGRTLAWVAAALQYGFFSTPSSQRGTPGPRRGVDPPGPSRTALAAEPCSSRLPISDLRYAESRPELKHINRGRKRKQQRFG